MVARGLLFVFEGPDGVGKSTLAGAFHEYLESRGLPAQLVAFPGNATGSLGHLVYQLQHEPRRVGVDEVDPASMQTLHAAAQIDTVRRKIVPALRGGASLVLDRYWWSTRVYGQLVGIPRAILNAIVKTEVLCWEQVSPDAIILLERDAPLRQGIDAREFGLLSELYKALAGSESATCNVFRVRNEGLREQVLRRIVDLVSTVLPRI